MKPPAFIVKLIAISLLTGMAASCKKVDIPFGESTISDPNIAFIDTISYNLATLQSDSFITSQSGALLIGRHTDPELGTMQAETYFHLATPGTSQIPTGAVYDSARLFVKLNGNYYGDTLAPFTLQAYTLAEDISLEGSTYFYNPQQFATTTLNNGSASFQVRPSLKDTLKLPVNNTLATTLFRMLRVNSDTLVDNDHYYQFIKGIAIRGTAGNKAVYSFNATDSSVFLRLFYHYTNPDPQTGYVDSKYMADNLQFNHVQTDRAGTSLAALMPFKKQRISSLLTGNKSYIQNAGGLQLRIDLPYLRNYRTEVTYRKILKAELYIRPYNYSPASIYKLPSSLTLYTASDDDYPSAYVLDKNTGTQQTVAPVIDNLYGKDTYYLFNISSYVTDIINGATENYQGLFLETPAYSTNNAIDRLILAKDPLYKSIEIRIYRLSL